MSAAPTTAEPKRPTSATLPQARASPTAIPEALRALADSATSATLGPPARPARSVPQAGATPPRPAAQPGHAAPLGPSARPAPASRLGLAAQPTPAGPLSPSARPAPTAPLGPVAQPAPASPLATAAVPVPAATLGSAAQPATADPLPASTQAPTAAALGVDASALRVRSNAGTDALLRAAGAPALVVGGTLLLPTTQPLTAAGARVLLAAVAQALDGRDGPVDPSRPLVDRARNAAPPGFDLTTPPAIRPLPAKPAPAGPAGAKPAGDGPSGAAKEGAVPAAGKPAAGTAQDAPADGATDGEAPAVAGDLAAAAGDEAAPAPPAAAAAAPMELLMPPAPTAPGPAQQARAKAVGGAAKIAAQAAKNLPSADATTAEARGAVTEPAAETAARAEAALTAELGAKPPASPEIVALCERIRTSIKERRPIDEDALKETDPEKQAKEAGAELKTAIGGETQKVAGSYGPLDNPAAGTPQLTPGTLAAPPPTVDDPGINAAAAAPDPIPPQDLSLDADKQAVDDRITESKIDRPSTAPITTPPFTTVREGQAELGEMAKAKPAEIALKQNQAIDTAQLGMAELQANALLALRASRGSSVKEVSGRKTSMVGSEESQRAKISGEARAIFAKVQAGVTPLVTGVGPKAMAQWTAGSEKLATEFKAHLAKVQARIDERHEGLWGTVVQVGDYFGGLPPWVTIEYEAAERTFGNGVCDLLLKISQDVNAVIAAAQLIITDARSRIDKLFSDLPAGLRAWAEGERKGFAAQLDNLDKQVTDARTSFVTEISTKAVGAVAAVQAEVEALRQVAKGLIGRVADAIAAFLDDPVTAIINGLLSLVGIAPASFWALVEKIKQVAADIADDPIAFLNNLVAALGQGFQQFFDNFGTHVIAGFWKWLFSGLGKLGVVMPPDVSVGSIVTLALQLMGITWPRIRLMLVKQLGEENVELIEKAWALVSELIALGPAGIFQLIKDALDPAKLVADLLESAVELVTEALIKAVTIRIMLLLNPVGAILQAIEAIYKVVKWVFENAAAIFQLVSSVVDSIADIIKGNIGGAAKQVEMALAATIPIVIDFLAGFLGLGDLPQKVAGVIEKLQGWVLGIVEKVIGFLVTSAKALLKKLGLGGKEEDDKKDAAEDTELGTDVRFSAGGESHHQWLDVTASGATPMVASKKVPVAEKLDEWEQEIATTFPDEAKRAEVQALIDAARGTLADLEPKAKTLAPEFATHKLDDEPLPSDAEIEELQRSLAGTLTQLFVLFGGDPEELLASIAKGLREHAKPRVKSALTEWWSEIATLAIRIGGKETDPLLWRYKNALADGSEAMTYVDDPATHEQLLSYFTTAAGKRDASAAVFGAYAFDQANATHGVRRGFYVALGDQAAAELRSKGSESLAASTKVTQEYKDALQAKIDAVAFTWTPGGGKWTLPPQRISVGGEGDTEETAIEIAWVKPALSGYKPITLAPPDIIATFREKKKLDADARISRDELIATKKSFGVKPTESFSLDGRKIGVSNPMSQTRTGFPFEAAAPATSDSQKNAFNALIERWGYNRDDNLDKPTDGDHVMEKQLGGPDSFDNVWPLNESDNRSSGGTVRGEVKRITKEYDLDSLAGKWLKLKFE